MNRRDLDVCCQPGCSGVTVKFVTVREYFYGRYRPLFHLCEFHGLGVGRRRDLKEITRDEAYAMVLEEVQES